MTGEFLYQVAGHLTSTHEDPCFLTGENGLLLKLLDRNKEINFEKDFYEEIFSCSQEKKELLNLRKFIPKYYGFKDLNLKNNKLQYLMLENLVDKFRKPCTLDIKLGKVSWCPYSSAEKRLKEESKCPSQKSTGFRVCGYQVYNPTTGQYSSLRGHAFSHVGLKEFPEILIEFLQLEQVPSRIAFVNTITARLKHILNWFENQRLCSFYGSSILISYDGMPHVNNPISVVNHNDKASNDALTSKFINQETTQDVKDGMLTLTSSNSEQLVLKMIDFSRSYIADGKADLDENYIHGLRNIIYSCEYLANNFSAKHTGSTTGKVVA